MNLGDTFNELTLTKLQAVANYVDTRGQDVNSAIRLYELLKTTYGLPKELGYVAALPRMKALIDEGWRPKTITLDQLLSMPNHSLGYHYGSHLQRAGLTLNKINDPNPITSPLEYVSHRMRETHDILHVLTGFDVSLEGELGVLGFGMAQWRSPVSLMLIPAFLYHALLNDGCYEAWLDSATKGICMGQQGVECIPACKFEEAWDKPLETWREELKIVPISPQ